MREIKFRAWVNGGMEEHICLNMWGYYFDVAGSWASSEIPVMQFTGLKDKNGKEIYEGDIIGGYDAFPNWVMELQNIGYGFHNCDTCLGFPHVGVGVVIGNIYENPELMK